jgi:RNA polymerase sigma-70 factor (sigma-E family)
MRETRRLTQHRLHIRVPENVYEGMKDDRVDSFDAFVIARGPALLRFAYLLSRDRHQAQDLVQEALCKTHRRWNRVQQPEAYVRRAILNDFLSWRRRRASGELVTHELPEPNGPRPSGHATANADRDAMWQLLARLPPQQRAVLVLRFYEDLDDSAIAGYLNCSQATVRAHASKALARLRSLNLNDFCVDGATP